MSAMTDPTTDPTARQPTAAPDPADAPPPVPPATPASPPPVQPPAPPPAWSTTPRRNEGGRWVGIVFGLILLGVGLWYFAERTLGLDMPDIHWGQLWPVILILIGVAVLMGGLRRDRR
jgi:Domain of unknown function (DUF5668)